MPLHRRDPWQWFDFDLRSDPTVYAPYWVHLELTSGGIVDGPALRAQITPSHGVSFGPDPDGSIPLTSIASGHVDIVQAPADLRQLRERYAWAYRYWQADEAIAVFQWIRDGVPAAELADHLCRPPDHILAKAARVDALLRAARQLPQPLTPPRYLREAKPERPTEHRRFDPPPWYAVAPGTDPTVYPPCDIHLDLYGSTAVIDVTPPDGCILQEQAVSYSTDDSQDYVRLADITSGRIGIRPAPADLTDLRETHRRAYEAWDRQDAKGVLTGGRQESGMPLERLVEQLSRPAEHILTKYAQLEAVAAAIVRKPRTEPAPYHNADRAGSGSWAVSVKSVSAPRTVADRHGAEPTYVAARGFFFAVLTDEQIESLRGDPDVEYVEKSALLRLL